MRINHWLVLAGFLALCLATGSLGGWITAEPVAAWYPTLVKPWFNPPSWVFGPAWTALYILMAVAAWLVWRTGERRALVLFFVQLALNLLWSVVFFGLRSPGAALVEVALLWLSVAATMAVFFRSSRAAGFMFVPYLAWVSFAGLLNWAIWRLN